MSLTLLEKQMHFSLMLSRLIHDLSLRGYSVTLGEAYRPLGVAAIYAEMGEGIKNSLHTLRLAVDLNIFHDGVFLKEKADLVIPGQIWESYSNDLVECVWGGRFERVDADHFSFAHNGLK